MKILDFEDIVNLPRVLNLFWENIDKGTSDECWLWNKSVDETGYGKLFVLNPETMKKQGLDAHRFSYLIHNGTIPENLCVLHSCDNKRCCNPEHLWLGTKGENNSDMYAKGRGRDHKDVSPETRQKLRESAEARPRDYHGRLG